MKAMITRHLVRCALAVCTLFMFQNLAWADPKLLTNPAEKFLVTPGSVDMRTGQYVYQNGDLSIGPENGGLALVRTSPNYAGGHNNPFANFSHNWDIMLMEAKVNFDSGDQFGPDYRMFAHIGGRTLTFESRATYTGFEYKGDGPLAVLTYSGGTRDSSSVVYTLRDPDGTLMTFRSMGSLDCSSWNWGTSAMRCSYISEMVQPDGTKLTFDYDYNSGLSNHRARLRKVVSSRGYALLLEGSGSRVTRACAFNMSQTVVPASNLCPSSGQPTVSYAYHASQPWLTSFTDPGGAAWTWSYGTSGTSTLMGFVKPGESTPWLTNTLEKRMDEMWAMQDIVASQAYVDGSSYTYFYGYAPFTNARPNPAIAGGSYKNAQNESVVVAFGYHVLPGTNPGFCPQQRNCVPPELEDVDNSVYQQTPGPVEITDQLGRTTTFEYCNQAMMASLPPYYAAARCYVEPLQFYVDPEGIRTELKYDAARNITEVRQKAKPGSGLADIVTAATYNCTYAVSCAKPVTMTDGKGAVSNFTYDSTHGEMLTKMDPAPTAGVARPLEVRTYTQKYAYIKNSGGSLVAASTPVWVPATETLCQTVAGSSTPTCDGSAPQRVTTYEYGANGTADNLLVRGVTVAADGQTLRTCYSYDGEGKKISETKPAANLSVCP